MGGPGSGRIADLGRDKVETCRRLDVNALNRAGCLAPGWSGGWRWSDDGEELASIQIRRTDDGLLLIYRFRHGGGEWESVAEPVQILWSPCRFGGVRPYFRCPGVVDGVACARRVVQLYAGGRYFLCRCCYRLAYATQSEPAWERGLRRANRLRRKLGGEPGMCAMIAPKPQGMWRRTYERLVEQICDAEEQADAAMASYLMKLRARTDGQD